MNADAAFDALSCEIVIHRAKTIILLLVHE